MILDLYFHLALSLTNSWDIEIILTEHSRGLLQEEFCVFEEPMLQPPAVAWLLPIALLFNPLWAQFFSLKTILYYIYPNWLTLKLQQLSRRVGNVARRDEDGADNSILIRVRTPEWN